MAYADFATEGLFEVDATTGNYVATADTAPDDGKAYYYHDTVAGADKYIYCVILPEQTTGLKVLDFNTYVIANEATGVDGMTYFDMYTQNNGEYYAKIIKVQ